MKKKLLFTLLLLCAVVLGMGAQEVKYIDRTWSGSAIVETEKNL